MGITQLSANWLCEIDPLAAEFRRQPQTVMPPPMEEIRHATWLAEISGRRRCIFLGAPRC